MRKPRSRPHQNRKGLRADFEVEAAAIAGAGLVEAGGVIGDDAREDIEPAGRAFGIGHARHAGRERQRLLDFRDINAADFQNRAGAEIHGVEHEALDLGLRFGCGAGHEAGADAESARSEPQVEARRLDLPGADGSRGGNGALLDKRRDGLRRKNA